MLSFLNKRLLLQAAIACLSGPTILALPGLGVDLHKRDAIFYQGEGDSYSAGPGAGSVVAGQPAYDCSRFTGGYPNVLQQKLNNAPLDPNNFLSCTGATAEDITGKQTADPNVQIVTLSVGGNNVGFGAIVNDCIYRFKGIASGNCEATLQDSANKINNDLGPAIQATMTHVLDTNSNVQLYVTGYVKFWVATTTQCDTVSWNYWQFSPENGSGEKMTQDRRQKMNDLVDSVNKKISDTVNEISQQPNYANRIHFVDYDASFEGHRFCEEGVIEPQRSGSEDRTNTFIFQYQTPTGQLWNPDDKVGEVDFAQDWLLGAQQAKKNDPSLQVSEFYANQPIDLSQDFSGGLPIFIIKVFHPTQAGHSAITDAVFGSLSPAVVSSSVISGPTATPTASSLTCLPQYNCINGGIVGQQCDYSCKCSDGTTQPYNQGCPNPPANPPPHQCQPNQVCSDDGILGRQCTNQCKCSDGSIKKYVDGVGCPL